jgi:hypothetical protein
LAAYWRKRDGEGRKKRNREDRQPQIGLNERVTGFFRHVKERTETEGSSEHGADENIWTEKS